MRIIITEIQNDKLREYIKKYILNNYKFTYIPYENFVNITKDGELKLFFSAVDDVSDDLGCNVKFIESILKSIMGDVIKKNKPRDPALRTESVSDDKLKKYIKKYILKNYEFSYNLNNDRVYTLQNNIYQTYYKTIETVADTIGGEKYFRIVKDVYEDLLDEIRDKKLYINDDEQNINEEISDRTKNAILIALNREFKDLKKYKPGIAESSIYYLLDRSYNRKISALNIKLMMMDYIGDYLIGRLWEIDDDRSKSNKQRVNIINDYLDNLPIETNINEGIKTDKIYKMLYKLIDNSFSLEVCGPNVGDPMKRALCFISKDNKRVRNTAEVVMAIEDIVGKSYPELGKVLKDFMYNFKIKKFNITEAFDSNKLYFFFKKHMLSIFKFKYDKKRGDIMIFYKNGWISDHHALSVLETNLGEQYGDIILDVFNNYMDEIRNKNLYLNEPINEEISSKAMDKVLNRLSNEFKGLKRYENYWQINDGKGMELWEVRKVMLDYINDLIGS